MEIVRAKTQDGYHFSGLLSRAEDSKRIIIHIHGMAGSVVLNKYYSDMHESYVKNGISFLVGEHRGTGTISAFVHDTTEGICGNAFEKFEDCVFDIQAWVDYARDLGFEEVWLQAHSLGPSKVAYYLSSVKNHGIKGAVLISPADMLGLVKVGSGKKDFDLMYPEAKRLQHDGRGDVLLSTKLWGDGMLSANTFLNFFEEGSKAAIFNFHDNKNWDTVGKIDIPVIAFTGTEDTAIYPVMDPYKAMEKLKSELKSSPKVQMIVYEGANHSFDGFGEKISDAVISFIL